MKTWNILQLFIELQTQFLFKNWAVGRYSDTIKFLNIHYFQFILGCRRNTYLIRSNFFIFVKQVYIQQLKGTIFCQILFLSSQNWQLIRVLLPYHICLPLVIIGYSTLAEIQCSTLYLHRTYSKDRYFYPKYLQISYTEKPLYNNALHLI